MNDSNENRLISPEDHVQAVIRSKAKHLENQRQLSFEEKLIVLNRLQQKAFFFGKTKVKPWPVEKQSGLIS